LRSICQNDKLTYLPKNSLKISQAKPFHQNSGQFIIWTQSDSFEETTSTQKEIKIKRETTNKSRGTNARDCVVK
jgi:hypothetical protein